MKTILLKIKEIYKSHGHDIFATLCMLLAAYIGYNLGRIEALEKQPLNFGQNASILNVISEEKNSKIFKAGESSDSILPVIPRDPRVVISKNSSSKKYHYSWCTGAKKIKPENQIWFTDEQAAQIAGYSLAGNCQ